MDARVVMALALLGLILAGSIMYMHNRIPILPSRIPLVAEYGDNGVVVLEQAVTPSPGTVWQLQQTPSGLMFVQTSNRLVEELDLSNVSLQGGDTIAPHLYDWWFDGVDDWMYIVGSGYWSLSSVSAGAYVRFDGTGHPALFGWSNTWTSLKGFQFKVTSSNQPWVVLGNGTAMWNSYLSITTSDGWHLYAFRYSGLSLRVFYDADSQTYDPGIGGIANGNVPIAIGTLSYGGANYPFKGWMSYFFVHSGAWTGIENLASGSHVVSSVITAFFDATWYNGTAYTDIMHGYTAMPMGGLTRIPAQQLWLWLFESLESDGNIHFRYMPPNTIIKLTDRTTGETWTYTVTGTANQAGLVPDYTIAPPTSNPVDIHVYVPSERIRFYVPPGFTVQMEDTNNGVTAEANSTDGVVTLAGGNIIRLIAQREDKLYLSVNDTPAVYRVTIRLPDNTPAANAYVWIRDPNGNTLAYGKTDNNGIYELAKNPNIPSAIRVEAAYLSSGTYYHAQQDFQLKAEDTNTPTVTPQPSLLSSSQFKLVAIGFGFLLVLLAAAILLAVRR